MLVLDFAPEVGRPLTDLYILLFEYCLMYCTLHPTGIYIYNILSSYMLSMWSVYISAVISSVYSYLLVSLTEQLSKPMANGWYVVSLATP